MTAAERIILDWIVVLLAESKRSRITARKLKLTSGRTLAELDLICSTLIDMGFVERAGKHSYKLTLAGVENFEERHA